MSFSSPPFVTQIIADGSSLPYVRATPVPATIGGVESGSTFTGSIDDALDALFYPYQYPSFSAFSFPQGSPLEVGDSVAAGDKIFSWATVNGTNEQLNTIQVEDITVPATLGTGLPDTGTATLAIAAAMHSVVASHSWKLSATNTHGGSFSRLFTLSWFFRIFMGESTNTSLTAAQIQALRLNAIDNSAAGTTNFLAGGYKYIAYPTSYGLITKFKDLSTGFDVAMDAVVTTSVTNAFGVTQDYYVHRTLNILGGAITVVIG